MVPVYCISRSQELKIDFLTKNLKNLLVRNHWTDFHIILQKWSFGDFLPRLFKPFGFVKKHDRQGGRGLFSLYIYIVKLKNLLVRNHWIDCHIILHKCSSGDSAPRWIMTAIKPRKCLSKNMAARGRGLFSLYIYIVNLKNLLVRNHWTDFHIILQKCSFDNPLPRLFKPFGFVKKHGRGGRGGGVGAGAGLIFPIYLYRKLKKNLLVRNHWIDGYIILQKCSFGDSIPRLFKPFGFVKKHGRQGVGLIFPIYLYRKLKKSSCQKPLDRFPYNFAEMFLWWSSTKIVQAIWICRKTWAPGGGAYFSYISI